MLRFSCIDTVYGPNSVIVSTYIYRTLEKFVQLSPMHLKHPSAWKCTRKKSPSFSIHAMCSLLTYRWWFQFSQAAGCVCNTLIYELNRFPLALNENDALSHKSFHRISNLFAHFTNICDFLKTYGTRNSYEIRCFGK